jgi:hypothetical protein
MEGCGKAGCVILSAITRTQSYIPTHFHHSPLWPGRLCPLPPLYVAQCREWMLGCLALSAMPRSHRYTLSRARAQTHTYPAPFSRARAHTHTPEFICAVAASPAVQCQCCRAVPGYWTASRTTRRHSLFYALSLSLSLSLPLSCRAVPGAAAGLLRWQRDAGPRGAARAQLLRGPEDLPLRRLRRLQGARDGGFLRGCVCARPGGRIGAKPMHYQKVCLSVGSVVPKA